MTTATTGERIDLTLSVQPQGDEYFAAGTLTAELGERAETIIAGRTYAGTLKRYADAVATEPSQQAAVRSVLDVISRDVVDSVEG
jgi:hypothetical protein